MDGAAAQGEALVTGYRVFKQRTDGDCSGCWEPVGTFQAQSTKGAIRSAAEQLGSVADGVTFAACAASAWSEQTVAVEAAPRVRFA